MSNRFDSTEDFYTVLANRGGFSSREPQFRLVMYTPNGICGYVDEYELLTRPTVDFLRDNCTRDDLDYALMCELIAQEWACYDRGFVDLDYELLARVYRDCGLTVEASGISYDFDSEPDGFRRLFDGAGCDCWHLDAMEWHMYNRETTNTVDGWSAWPDCESVSGLSNEYAGGMFSHCMSVGDFVGARDVLRSEHLELTYSNLALELSV